MGIFGLEEARTRSSGLNRISFVRYYNVGCYWSNNIKLQLEFAKNNWIEIKTQRYRIEKKIQSVLVETF